MKGLCLKVCLWTFQGPMKPEQKANVCDKKKKKVKGLRGSVFSVFP